MSPLLGISTHQMVPSRTLSNCLISQPAFANRLAASTGNPVTYWERPAGKLPCQIQNRLSRIMFPLALFPLMPYKIITIATVDRQDSVGLQQVLLETLFCANGQMSKVSSFGTRARVNRGNKCLNAQIQSVYLKQSGPWNTRCSSKLERC